MSRTAVEKLTLEQRAEPIEPVEMNLSDVPTLDRDGAREWFREELGVEISNNLLKTATADGELPWTSLGQGGRACYSTRDLWYWLMSRRRSAADRAVAR